jgi:hypothetical protein
MAYIKYKELTKYFNFNKRLEIETLPKYVLDYVDSNEKIIAAYKTSRDKSVFTDKRMILFDVTPFTKKKKVHILPYKSIDTATIEYNIGTVALFLSFTSGYQLRLNFVKMSASDKSELRILFSRIMKDQK